MDNSHLTYILQSISNKEINVYGLDAERSIMGNYIRAVQELDISHKIKRDKRGFKYIEMFRSDGSPLGTIEPALLPSCPASSRKICNSKIITSRILESKGVRVPLGKTYSAAEEEKASIEVFSKFESVAVKAHSLSLGRGIYLDVRKDDFHTAFTNCLAVQKKRGHSPHVIVQEMVSGFEMRATVIEGKLDNVLVRIPAYVTGNGKSTIDQLIDKKNEQRANCGFFGNKLIQRDHNLLAYISSYGINLASVPKDGEHILLSSISNASYGGETAVVTDLVSTEIKETAVQTAAAIPGVKTAGIDIMAASFDSRDPVVLEANTFPHAQLSIYPYFGEGTNPLKRYLEAFIAEDKYKNGWFDIMDESERLRVADYFRFYALKDRLSLKEFQ